MNQSSLSLPFIVAGVFATLAIGVALLRRRHRSVRVLSQTERINRERQEFVISRGNEISMAVANSMLRADELKQITDRILAEIDSRNDGGCLDAYLADTRDFLAEEVAKRAAT